MAEALGWSQTTYRRFESGAVVSSIVDVACAAAVLGLELGAALYPAGDPIRDRGHQALIKRFRDVLAASIRVVADVPLPLPGDRRAWDLLLHVGTQLIGIEVETRIRDIQQLVRHVHVRERDGHANHVVLVLGDSSHNRALLSELMQALGASFQTPPAQILRALRAGESLPGSGVILL